MKIRDYMKKGKKISSKFFIEILIPVLECVIAHKKIFASAVCAVLILPILLLCVMKSGIKEVSLDDVTITEIVDFPIVAAATAKGSISIPAGIVKANPFVPYRDISGASTVLDVPAYNLVEPPEMINENSDAARVMDTIVSGILYDKYSPSAILNIEGNDYLVKKGDVVNNYKVLNIMQDSVTVKLGSNVYKAGIGEILTEGALNRNDVSNLNNKFGGVR